MSDFPYKKPTQKQLRGRFHLNPGLDDLDELIETINNNIVDEGETAFLRMIAVGASDDVSLTGNFYIGLCGASIAETTSLGNLPSEPSGNGYARKAIERSNVGFPTIDRINDVARALSKTVTFTASGGSISSFQRLFLCNTLSGTVGKLFAISGALTSARTIADGESLPVAYELYMK